MSYLITVPTYPIGKVWLQEEIDRMTLKLNACHYIVGEYSFNGDSIVFKVIYIVND